jgi:hypothetical protein
MVQAGTTLLAPKLVEALTACAFYTEPLMLLAVMTATNSHDAAPFH